MVCVCIYIYGVGKYFPIVQNQLEKQMENATQTSGLHELHEFYRESNVSVEKHMEKHRT